LNGPLPSDAAAIWLATSDEILAGLSHALNNRLAAVGSIARVLEFGDAGDLYGSLVGEIEQLEATVALLHLIPRTDEDHVEPVRLEDFVEPLIQLHALRRDARDIDFVLSGEDMVPPGFVEPVLLSRSILVALSTVGRVVRRNGGTRVDLRCVGGDSASLLIEGAAPVAKGDIYDCELELRAARALAHAAGAHLELEHMPEGPGLTLRLILPSESPKNESRDTGA
jgi:hypothetical protein